MEEIGDFDGEVPTVESLILANTSPSSGVVSKKDLSKMSVEDL